jgi:uncharacterized membrane protein YvlD (DUF360 family)
MRNHPGRYDDPRRARGVPVKPRVLAGALAIWLIAGLAFLAAGSLLPGVHVASFGAALAVAAAVGAINALAWPALIWLALPLTVLTLGLAVLILNGLVILLGAAIVPGVEIDGLGDAILCALMLTAVTTLAAGILSIDDEARLARHRANRMARAKHGEQPHSEPGIAFLEIDGLAHDVLRRALRDGYAPNLARWVRDGSHRLVRWETDWSSQTGACQAGLLHGSNEDMPAFRWWEKEQRRAIVTNHPRDAAELERRVSDGRGLLHAGGASRANILSGDAPSSLLTMSTVLDVRRSRLGHDYFAYFASPYNVARTALLTFADIFSELRSAARQRRRDVQPRIHRGWKYALVRAWATVIQRDLQVESVLGDLVVGRPVLYTTFLAYDEVAHHSGVERPETLAVLAQLDREIGRIERAARDAPRPYELVVLSDHGQTQGATFLQRYGLTLEQLVRQACEGYQVHAETSGEDEALGRLSAALTEASQDEGRTAQALRAVTRSKRVDGEVRLGDPETDGAGPELPELVVLASGCLGLISFPRRPGRVTREQIEERLPRLLPTLVAHPGIGFVLVRTETEGAVVLGAHGAHWLDSGRVEGIDPLAPFGEHAAHHVARTDRFLHCPDILVNSTYWPETDEVAAFEELVGSHGGLGGSQSFPFILAPTALELADEPLIGAEAVHRMFRSWLAGLGHRAYAVR